ncbi:MAG: 4Fe-4S dicluster domain-containing protein [Aigarchaeota archaeon]|nr:4Fe-4S dicluster domain-containing protein [Aigarchaeota archaeon]
MRTLKVKKRAAENLLRRLLDVEKLKYCQDCGACTASCSMAKAIPEHYNPRNLLLKAVLDYDRVLREDEVWLCAWCYRCYERCPQGLKPTEIFLLTRNFAAEKERLPDSYQALIKQILRTGRVMECTADIDELRESYGLPKIGPAISERALDDIKRITEKTLVRRLKQ